MSFSPPEKLFNKKLKIKNIYFRELNFGHYFSSFIDSSFLLQHSFTGYLNSPNSKLRICSSLWTAFWLTASIYFVLILLTNSQEYAVTNQLFYFKTFSACFVAIFFKETASLHRKWSYLAGVFNDILKMKPDIPFSPKTHIGMCPIYRQRAHLHACLAHDLLVMGMWNHVSFQGVFRSVLFNAYLEKFKFDKISADKFVDRICYDGISYQEADDLISEYITTLAPSSYCEK